VGPRTCARLQAHSMPSRARGQKVRTTRTVHALSSSSLLKAAHVCPTSAAVALLLRWNHVSYEFKVRARGCQKWSPPGRALPQFMSWVLFLCQGSGRLRCHRLGPPTCLPPQNYGTWCAGGPYLPPQNYGTWCPGGTYLPTLQNYGHGAGNQCNYSGNHVKYQIRKFTEHDRARRGTYP
jgi:hypothetical protein